MKDAVLSERLPAAVFSSLLLLNQDEQLNPFGSRFLSGEVLGHTFSLFSEVELVFWF